MDSKEKEKLELLRGRVLFANDSLTVSHIGASLEKDFTVSHLAQRLGSNTQTQSTNTPQAQDQTTNPQTQQGEGEAAGQKKG
ncbi:MAG: hypothetical protein LAO30_08225 [Acidobacteriia bacterium]|nr:hypothetical protein [Terriglobia bacterium]